MNTGKNKYLKNTLLNFIFKFISMGITYLTIPITLKYLQKERYGIWQTILTIISWAALSNFGIGNGLRNKITEAISANDNKKLKGYITNAYIYLSGISAILLIIGVILISFLNVDMLFKNRSIARYEIIFCFTITIFSFCLNFILGISSSIAYGIHRSSLVNLFQTITNIITLIGLIILKNMSSSSLIYISMVYFLANSISNIVFSIVIFIEKKYRPNIKYYNKELGKNLTSLGLEFFILQIATLMLFSTDNFIISGFIGVGDVTGYSIASKLFQLVSTVFSILLIQLWSVVAEASFKKDYLWIRKSIKKLMLLLVPTFVVISIMLINFKFITKVWLGTPLELDKKLIFSCAFYSLLICFNGIFVNVQNGMSRIRVQTVSSVICCLLNIPLAIFFIRVLKLGLFGVMLSNIICLSITSIMCSIDVYKYLYSRERRA